MSVLAANPHTFPSVIDATMRRDFVACPTRFWYSYVRQIALSGQPSIHLHAGAAFARGLEIARNCFYLQGMDSHDSVAEGMLALIRAWGDRPDPEQDGSNAAKKTLNAMCGALVDYFREYRLGEDSIQPYRLASGKLAVECSFALPFGIDHPDTGEPLLYCGRYDMLGIRDGVLFGVDEKTTTQLGATWPLKWHLRSQFTGYTWGAREFGYPCAGFIIRGISILKSGYGHAQTVEYRPDWQVDRWLEQLRRDVQRMIESWRTQHWDMNLDDSCTSYGRGCQFANLCDSSQPEALIPINYEHREWNPLERSDD